MEGSLPENSILRQELLAGERGDGIRRKWMDQMRSSGVRRAIVVLYRPPDKTGRHFEVSGFTLYRGYDCDDSEITDPAVLKTLESIGLVASLKAAAVEMAPRTSWYRHDSNFIPVNLFDDERLPEISFERAAEHVKSLATKIPKSELRDYVESGLFGLGVCHNWMSTMRNLGINQARLTYDVTFAPNGAPEKIRLKNIEYLRTYGDLNSRISDENAIAAINEKGLTQELDAYGSRLATKGVWFDIPRPAPDPFEGRTTLDIFDDPWLTETGLPTFYVKGKR
jgi:hypothetical protein